MPSQSPSPESPELTSRFMVETSDTGDTVMVHAPRALTVLVRGHVAKKLEDTARQTGIPITRLLEEAITQYLNSRPPART